jgi:hypothetical protein
MKKRTVFFTVLLCAGFSMADDSITTNIEPLSKIMLDNGVKKNYNPYISLGASMIIPGSGQLYTRHYVKGASFLLLEGITGYTSYYWLKLSNDQRDLRYSKQSIITSTSQWKNSFDSLQAFNEVRLLKQDELLYRYRGYNALAWAAGGYVYNVFDMIDHLNLIDKSGSRNPATAGWLSAIPGLALGQWYNGSVSKAGLVFMGQMGLGVVAYNYHRLMRNSEKEINNLSYSYTLQDTLAIKKKVYYDQWESERKNAFTNRNMYLWYSVFFYFFGIFDAVVDAHLHDFSDKMNMYPDLVPLDRGAKLQMNMKF